MSQPRSSLAGTRIRERRLQLGVKQVDLARRVDVSASYLNLIEHNRRRIGGKLMLDIAAALETDPALLAQGAEKAAVQALGKAAAKLPGHAPEVDRADELAGRFPGWAALVAAQTRRIEDLEQTVATLSDRLTHDPHLAASLHDVISTVTAIRSSVSILSETPDLEPEWRARFQRNVFEESERLVDGSQRLVAYLDRARDAGQAVASPREEFEAFLAQNDFHFEALEGEAGGDPGSLVEGSEVLGSATARSLARKFLTRYRQDALALALEPFAKAAQSKNFDPGALAGLFSVDMATILRRLAALPLGLTSREIGLAICDGSGALTYSKPVEGFALPRLGSACPLWSLYQALARPMVPLRRLVETPGAPPQRFLTYAVSQPTYPGGFDGPPVTEASMLILGDPEPTIDARAEPVGIACPICPRTDCPARREPAILSGGL